MLPMHPWNPAAKKNAVLLKGKLLTFAPTNTSFFGFVLNKERREEKKKGWVCVTFAELSWRILTPTRKNKKGASTRAVKANETTAGGLLSGALNWCTISGNGPLATSARSSFWNLPNWILTVPTSQESGFCIKESPITSVTAYFPERPWKASRLSFRFWYLWWRTF